MNDAEKARDARVAAMGDGELLEIVTADDEAITAYEREKFSSMSANVGRGGVLSKPQRDWAELVARRVIPWRASEVPRGREVETPAVLKTLPKKPPGR